MNNIDLSKTTHIIFFIVLLPVLSIILVLLFSKLLSPLESWWGFPFLDTVGGLGAYAMLFSLFDKKLWRLSIFKQANIVSFPDLNGRWNGYIKTSHNDMTSKVPAILEVNQTFSSIKVFLYTELSTSSSLMAGFRTTEDERLELHYEYINEPNEKASSTMHGHEGTAKLWPKNDSKIVGSYYTTTQHNRGNIGSLNFSYECEETLKSFGTNKSENIYPKY